MLGMRTDRLVAAAFGAVALWALGSGEVSARGPHGGGHGGAHRGGHHGGGVHHGGHHAHHPYHPSHHHAEHHAAHRHHAGAVHHYRHHHHSWHYGPWGSGFWGGAAVGYGFAYAAPTWGYGGNTYVDNSTSVDDSAAQDDGDAAATVANETDGTHRGLPVDDWPELGISTYSGQYGGTQGLVIVRVIPHSAADKAGAVAGDVILAVNGEPVPNADALETALDSADGKFALEVWDARTGRRSALSGLLDPAAPNPKATSAAR